MDIQFSSSKLNRIFNSEKQLLREYGKETSKKIRLRMAVLRNAKTLAEVPKKQPDRCHGLKGNRIGQYAVDLNHPFRLVFEPVGTILARKDGAVDESTVTVIKILKVEDYHIMDARAQKVNYYEPDYPVHPGEYLEEILESREIKKREFAERVGLSVKAVSQIINGKALYSPEVALRFERVLGINASIWSGLAESYQLFAAKKEESRKLQADQVTEWVKRFPISDLKKLNILPNTRKHAELAEALLRYLGVSSIESWESYSIGKAAAYRQSAKYKISREAVEIWLTIAEREAGAIEVEPYNKKLFTEALFRIRSFTQLDPNDFFPQMVNILAETGVALVVVPELKGSRICGATRWLAPTKAMIALSLRYKTNDQFWFTFYHEAAHILLHGRKIFIDQNGGDDRKEEREADEYAGNLLIPKAEYRTFSSAGNFYEASICRFAKEIGIHPGILVGRLQHDGLLDFKFHNSLKEKFDYVYSSNEECC